MNPRLFAIAGPLEGAFFALPERDVAIGRDSSNLLAIDDGSVAAEHCVLEWDSPEFRLHAIGRTSVNGLPADGRRLVHGDELRVGDCLFLYLILESETPLEVRLERDLERLTAENRRLVAEVNLEHDMIAESRSMRRVLRQVSKAALSQSTVLIRGESGTGKELVARALHCNSPRAAAPFVSINSACIAEALLESELFGYERGAFTGAVSQKRGKLEMAGGGTVFLDEIGELAPALQSKLLRVLQEREFERLGGTRTLKLDVRVIAATNRDLEEAVARGEFRQDLYYRLNVVALELPPLRQRREDILHLARHFAFKFSRRCHRDLAGLAPGAERALVAHDWPGNVRELENAIERAVVLGSTPLILTEDLPESVLESSGPPEADGESGYHAAVNAAKRRIVLDAMERGGSFSQAARVLGLDPNNLHRLVRSLGLRSETDWLQPGIASRARHSAAAAHTDLADES